MRCCEVDGESLWKASLERPSISTFKRGDACDVTDVTFLLSLANDKLAQVQKLQNRKKVTGRKLVGGNLSCIVS